MCVSLISFSAFKIRPGVLWKRPDDFIKFQRRAGWAELSRFPWWRCREQFNREGKYSRGQQQPKALQLSVARSAPCRLRCRAPALASPWDLFIVQAKVWKGVNCTRFFLRKWGSRRLNLSSRPGWFSVLPSAEECVGGALSALLLTPAPTQGFKPMDQQQLLHWDNPWWVCCSIPGTDLEWHRRKTRK